jgi:site-specific recombinase XerD
MAKWSDPDLLVEAWLTSYGRVNTARTNRAALKDLQTWASKSGIDHICEMKAPHFDLYLSYLRSKKLAGSSINSKQGAIRAFFNYLVDSGELKKAPVTSEWLVKYQYRPAQLPRLSPEEIVRTADFAKHTTTRLAIILSGLEGIKLLAIRQIEVGDINFDSTGRATVVVKRQTGVHSRPVGEVAANILAERIAEIGSGLLLSEAEVDRFRLLRRIRAAAKNAGIDVAVTPRILQGSYVTTALASGVPLDALAKDLGRAGRLQWYAAQDGPGGEGERLRQEAAQAAGQLDAAELLSQAKALCDERSITSIAPMVIAGAALELVLRRMCEAANCMPTRGSIESYASRLYRAKLLSKEDLGQVQASGKLRNAAAHGTESAAVTIPTARLMIESVLLFISGPEIEIA